MDERLRQLELRRLARRRRFRLIGFVLLILVGGAATNAYLAFRPAHVSDVVQRSLRNYFGDEVRFASGIDVDLPDGIRVHHLRLESGADPVEVSGGTGVRLTSTTLEIRRIHLMPRLWDLLIGRLVVGRVIIDSPVLSVGCVGGSCDRVGALLHRFTDSLADYFGGRRRLPRLEIRGGEVLYETEDSAGDRHRYRLFNIDGHATLLETGEVRLEIAAQSPYLESLELRARRSLEDGTPLLEFELDRVDLAAVAPEIIRPTMQALLSPDMIDGLDVQGTMDLAGEIRVPGRGASAGEVVHPDLPHAGGAPGDSSGTDTPETESLEDQTTGVEIRRLSGSFAGAHVRLPQLTLPLEDLDGSFSFENDRLDLNRVTGRLGAGRMRADGAIHFTPALDGIEAIEGTFSAEALPAKANVFPGVREALSGQLDQLRVNGTFGVSLALTKTSFPLGQSTLDNLRGEVTLDRLSVLHRSFPLRFEEVAGSIVLEKGDVVIPDKLTGRHRNGRVTVMGQSTLRPTGALEFTIDMENVALDEQLRNALPSEAVHLWDELRPSGYSDLRFDIERETGSEAYSEILVKADLRDAACVVQRFPCQFSGVSGALHVDLLKRRIELVDLEGKHNGERSRVVGYFEYGDDGLYLVKIATPRMTVAPDSETALAGDLGRVTGEFGLSGLVGSVVTIENRRAGALEVSATVEVEDLQVEYRHFPYPLRLRSGSIEVDHLGRLTLRELRTDDADSPRVELSGTLNTVGAARVFDYRADVERLEVDDMLIKALPEDTRRFVTGLGLGGTFAGLFEGRFTYDADRPSQGHSIYRASQIRTEDASVEFGPKLFDIVATGKFQGRRGLAETHRFSGELDAESTRFNRVRMQHSKVHFALGEELPGLVDLRQGVVHDGSGFEPLGELMDRLHVDRIENTFQAHIRSSKLYGGDLEGFLYVDIGTQHDFGGEFVGRDVQVALASEDVFNVSGEGLSGHAEGQVRFSGTTGDLGSMKGKGEGRIESAELAQLPVGLSIVSWLTGRLTVDPRLREVLLAFTIEDLAFVCEQPEGLVIQGDGIYLSGGGKMNFDCELDLRLTPSIIERKIPLIGFLFDVVKNILLPVRILGSIEDPKVRFSALGVPVGAGVSDETGDEPERGDAEEDSQGSSESAEE